jgi:hypothetical protein
MMYATCCKLGLLKACFDKLDEGDLTDRVFIFWRW